MSFYSWLDWSTWMFGVRADWQPFMRFVVVEIGPIGLCLEFDSRIDAPAAVEEEEG